MNKRSLTYDEFKLLTFSNDEIKVRQYFEKFGSGATYPGSTEIPNTLTYDKLITMITHNLGGNKWKLLKQQEEKAITKWWGIQGLTPNYDTAVKLIENYYNYQPHLTMDWSKGINHLYTLCHEKRNYEVIAPQLEPISWYDAYIGTINSNFAGISSLSKKNSADNGIIVFGLTPVTANLKPYKPAMAGTRHSNNKLRAIFMDDYYNVIQ